MMSLEFTGRRALVTGAGKGIGRAMVRELVKRGATVVALSRTQSTLDTLLNEFPKGKVEIVCVDISDWNATRAKVSEVMPIDLLVNNAGIFGFLPLEAITEEDVDKYFATNFKSVINITQVVVKSMKERGTGGSIVNVSSIAALFGGAYSTLYGSTKAALDKLTKSLCTELGSSHIRINSVNPTVVDDTDMGQVALCAVPENKHKKFLSRHPLGRLAKTEDVCSAILFFLSDKSSIISGTILPVDAGFIVS